MTADSEYAMRPDDEGHGTYCPYCGSLGDPQHVLCVKCGYHRGLNRKIETVLGEAALPEEEPPWIPEQIDFGTFCIPVRPLLVCCGAAVLMALIMYFVVPTLLAILLLLAGLVLLGIGNLWIAVIAAHESLFMALAVWFAPFFWLYYVVSRFEEVKLPLGIAGTGCLMIFFGLGIIA